MIHQRANNFAGATREPEILRTKQRPAERQMRTLEQLYIDGRWLPASGRDRIEVIDPATEEPCASLLGASTAQVAAAVSAARAAFEHWRDVPVARRIACLEHIAAGIKQRAPELAALTTEEMGIPCKLANDYQVAPAEMIFSHFAQLLGSYRFERVGELTTILKEPIGVCALITPWNFPLTQIALKLAPALAAGCTVVLKPSELTPSAATVLAQIIAEAGLPAGTFNLVHGTGPLTGVALCEHPQVDMISITGSTRAGASVAGAGAATIKRVTQELGGKSAYLILDDVDLDANIAWGVRKCFANSGQACDAPTRMLVPASLHDAAVAAARAVAQELVVGDPRRETTDIGPLANGTQFSKVKSAIERGIEQGATLVTGGAQRPPGCNKGYFVEPTVFSDVDPRSALAQQEIFGPVLCIIPFQDDAHAVRIANDTDYGLAAYIAGRDLQRIEDITRRLRCGQVRINRSPFDIGAPFGGYKHSGNGREGGVMGLEEYLETKACMGFRPAGAVPASD